MFNWKERSYLRSKENAFTGKTNYLKIQAFLNKKFTTCLMGKNILMLQ